LAAWTAGVTIFAWRRIPFYDEWYSISLARDATWSEFKASLAGDVHPPWLALLDRALVSLCPDRRILCLPRVAASLAAILLLRQVVMRQWPRLGPFAPALAAFHPIVFMYAGAARWYPYAFLADAVRAWALWGTSDRRRSARAFFAGTVFGVMSGYAEALLAAVDAAWLVGRERDRRAVATVGAAGAAALVAVLVAPFVAAWPHPSPGSGGSFVRSLLTWGALGPLGSALVPWPYTVVALLAVPGLVWGLARTWTSPPFSLWMVAVAASWAAMAYHVEHPRYSIGLWFLTTCALGLVRGSPVAAAARIATATYLGLALALAVRGRDFAFKDDNEMAPSDCAQLVPTPHTLVVTSYLRTAEELRVVCGVEGVVSARNARIYAPRSDLDPVRAALRSGEVTFVHPNAPGTLLDDANDRLRAMLAESCKSGDVREAAPLPLGQLRRALQPRAPLFHYASETWLCDEVTP
jgi:hypothetical protein